MLCGIKIAKGIGRKWRLEICLVYTRFLHSAADQRHRTGAQAIFAYSIRNTFQRSARFTTIIVYSGSLLTNILSPIRMCNKMLIFHGQEHGLILVTVVYSVSLIDLKISNGFYFEFIVKNTSISFCVTIEFKLKNVFRYLGYFVTVGCIINCFSGLTSLISQFSIN